MGSGVRTPGLPAGSLASHRLSPSSLSGQSSAYFAPLSTEADSCFPASQRLPLETWRKQRPLPPGRERADRRLRLPFGRFAWVQYRDLSLAHVKTEALKTGGHKPGVTAHCGTCRAGAAFAPSAPWDTIVAVDVGAGEGLSFLQWRCSLAIRLGVVLGGWGVRCREGRGCGIAVTLGRLFPQEGRLALLSGRGVAGVFEV